MGVGVLGVVRARARKSASHVRVEIKQTREQPGIRHPMRALRVPTIKQNRHDQGTSRTATPQGSSARDLTEPQSPDQRVRHAFNSGAVWCRGLNERFT